MVGSNLEADADYDQMAFFPEQPGESHFTGQHGIFDFDTAVFPDLWAQLATTTSSPKARRNAFEVFLRYYLSDHRPMWMELIS